MRVLSTTQARGARGTGGRLIVALTLLVTVTFPAAASEDCRPAPPSPDGAVAFTDQTAASGLVEPLTGMHGHAVAFGDVDDDGWQDLFVGTFANRPDADYAHRGATGASPDRLLRGGPDGFVMDTGFPEMYGRTSGATFADLDGDGDLDLVVARNYRDRYRSDAPTVVLRNDDGAFSVAATLVTDLGARSVGVLDYDGDERLDLFVTEDRWSGGRSVLLHNDGDLGFSDATASAGLPPDVHGLGVSTADLTGDGWADLLVTGSIPPDAESVVTGARLFVSTGSGAFREADASAFTWTSYGNEDDVAGVAVADLDRDGLPDIVVGQHYGSTLSQGRAVPVRVYQHTGVDSAGDPAFRDVTAASGVNAIPTKAPHVEVADFDNDGWPDIVTTGSAGDGTGVSVLRNLGVTDGTVRFAAVEGLGASQYWPTAATVDVDGDGRLDVFAVEWYPSLPSPLFRNESAAGRHLVVRGEGAPVGAVVEVYCTGRVGDPAALVGRRHIEANAGFGAGVPSQAHFGLGDVQAVDVRVVPPAGGPPVVRANVPADQVLEIGPPGVPPTVRVDDVWLIEGQAGSTAAQFAVSLSEPSDEPVSVSYATKNGSARAEGDYRHTTGTLSFAAGETTKPVTVPVAGDLVAEGNETFALTLSEPTGAVLADATALATIVDEEGPLRLWVTDATTVEGDSGQVTVTPVVTLSAPPAPGQRVTVKVATANASATAAADYTGLRSRTLTFSEGQTTKPLPIAVLGDTLAEADERLTVNLTKPSGAVLSDASAAVTILDDDS